MVVLIQNSMRSEYHKGEHDMIRKHILTDRRFIVCTLAVVLLFILGLRGVVVSDSIALIAISLAGANAGAEAAKAFARHGKKKPEPKKGE